MIARLYPDGGAVPCVAELPGRTLMAVQMRATVLGVHVKVDGWGIRRLAASREARKAKQWQWPRCPRIQGVALAWSEARGGRG